MAKSNGIKDLKQAAKLLNKHAPKGEALAYINPEEAKVLRSRGGTGIQTLSGVPSYWSWDWLTGDDGLISKGKKLLGYDKPVDEGGRSIVNDAIGVYGFLKAKKDQEGLNKFEMEQFNNLTAQLSEAQAQFDANIGGGPLVTDIPTKVEDVASFTEVDLPTMRTTAVAQGGRIGYQQGIGPNQGSPSIMANAATDMEVEDAFGLSVGDAALQRHIRQLAEQSASPEDFPATDSDFQALEVLSEQTDVALEEIIQVAKSLNFTAPEQFKGEMYSKYMAQGGRIGYQQGTHPLDGVAMEMFGMTFENLNPLQQIVVSQSQSKAYGGRIGYDSGGNFMMASAPDPTAEMNDFSMQVFGKPLHQLTPPQLESLYELMNEQSKAPQQNSGIMQAAIGGRAGYNMGGIGAMKPRMGYQDAGEVVEKTFSEGVYQEFPSDHRGAINVNETQMAVISDMNNKGMDTSLISTISGVDEDTVIRYIGTLNAKAQGGRIGAQKGGIMPLLNMGGMEKDYRQNGGFVPIGRKEKADDVPARLSKNEFVFTADAVRAAGGGDIDQGAQRMYNVMKNLEAGGEISKQSQGQK